jgi:thioredoxin 1
MIMNDAGENVASKDDELDSLRTKRKVVLSGKVEGDAKPVHVDDASFNEVTSKHALALIDFWASWCGPCRALAPTIEELAKEYNGRVFIAKINVDENPETAEGYKVYSIPTMVILKNGKEVDRIVGCVQKRFIEEALMKHLMC